MDENFEISIEEIKEKLLTSKSFESLASFYSLFADATRLKIICLLVHHELCVTNIAEILGVSQSVVSHQLATLRKHDIVDYHRVGKQVLYALTDNHIKDIFSTGLEHTSEKDEDLYKDRKSKGF